MSTVEAGRDKGPDIASPIPPRGFKFSMPLVALKGPVIGQHPTQAGWTSEALRRYSQERKV